MTRRLAPLPLTAEVWRRLTRQQNPRVRGLILNGRPCILLSTAPRRAA